jgi:hypothetical protein
MKTVAPAILIVIGAAILGLSFTWPSLSRRGGWSAEDAAKLRELDDQVVKLHYQFEAPRARTGGKPLTETPPVLRQAIDERNQLRARRDAALERPGRVSAVLRYVGIGVLLLGIVARYATASD